MSAVNGIYNHKSFTDVENKVKLMNSLNRHRGPNFSNTYLDSTICLGHNRLLVIDLNSNSNQPFISLDKNSDYEVFYNIIVGTLVCGFGLYSNVFLIMSFCLLK